MPESEVESTDGPLAADLWRGSDYYALLDITTDADGETIATAVRNQRAANHPDQADDPEAARRRYEQVSKAEEVLTDSTRRELYDLVGHDNYVTTMGAAGNRTAGDILELTKQKIEQFDDYTPAVESMGPDRDPDSDDSTAESSTEPSDSPETDDEDAASESGLETIEVGLDAIESELEFEVQRATEPRVATDGKGGGDDTGRDGFPVAEIDMDPDSYSSLAPEGPERSGTTSGVNPDPPGYNSVTETQESTWTGQETTSQSSGASATVDDDQEDETEPSAADLSQRIIDVPAANSNIWQYRILIASVLAGGLFGVAVTGSPSAAAQALPPVGTSAFLAAVVVPTAVLTTAFGSRWIYRQSVGGAEGAAVSTYSRRLDIGRLLTLGGVVSSVVAGPALSEALSTTLRTGQTAGWGGVWVATGGSQYPLANLAIGALTTIALVAGCVLITRALSMRCWHDRLAGGRRVQPPLWDLLSTGLLVGTVLSLGAAAAVTPSLSVSGLPIGLVPAPGVFAAGLLILSLVYAIRARFSRSSS